MNFLRQAVTGAWNFFSKNDSGNIHIPVVAKLEDKVNQYVENKVELKELQEDEEDGMPDVNRDRKKENLEELIPEIEERIKHGLKPKTGNEIIEKADKLVIAKELSLQLPQKIAKLVIEIESEKRKLKPEEMSDEKKKKTNRNKKKTNRN